MNKENLLRMADFIEIIPEELFSMNDYRMDQYMSHKCNSVGCAIGHSVILDNIENIPMLGNYAINFSRWSEMFTGLVSHDMEWEFCFCSYWVNVDNTPIGVSNRIRYLVNKGSIELSDLLLFKAPIELIRLI